MWHINSIADIAQQPRRKSVLQTDSTPRFLNKDVPIYVIQLYLNIPLHSVTIDNFSLAPIFLSSEFFYIPLETRIYTKVIKSPPLCGGKKKQNTTHHPLELNTETHLPIRTNISSTRHRPHPIPRIPKIETIVKREAGVVTLGCSRCPPTRVGRLTRGASPQNWTWGGRHPAKISFLSVSIRGGWTPFPLSLVDSPSLSPLGISYCPFRGARRCLFPTRKEGGGREGAAYARARVHVCRVNAG